MSDAKIKISAEDNASRVLSQVRGSMAQLQSTAAALTGALGLIGVSSLGGIALLVKNVVDGIDAFNDLKDATGASIENISALEDVALRTGTSMDTVSTALVKFNGVLKDAKPSSDAEAALKALGLSAKDLKDLDPAEALLQTAKALSGYADDANKARIVQELFGKSLKQVAPLLKDLADAGQLNAKVTTEQAEAAEKFNKELFNLQKNATDAGRSVAGPLIAAINESIERFRVGEIAGKSYYTVIREEQLRLLGLNDGPKEYAERLAEVTAALTKGEPRLLVRNALLREQAELQAKLNALPNFSADNESAAEKARLQRRKSAPADFAVDKPKSKKAEEIDDASRSLASYIQGLQSTIDTTEKLSEQQKALNFLKSIGTTGEIAQVRELVLGRAAIIDGLKAEADAQKLIEEARKSSSKYLDELAKEQQAQEKNNETLRQQVEEIGLTKDQLNALTLRRLDDAIATQEQNRAQLDMQNSSEAEIASMERKIALLKEQRNITAGGQVAQAAADSKESQDKASKEFADTLQNDLKGAFSAAFRDSSGDPLQAFGDALANVIYSRAATALAESLMGAAGGSGGSFLSSLFSFDGGGSTGNGARAGGLDGKGGFLAMMHPQETVLDHTKGQTGGGGTTVIQNFTVGDVASVSMVRAAVAGSERRIAGAMGRSMQYGGALA